MAIGNAVYAQWAANMAVSLKYHNPGMPIALVVDPACKAHLSKEELGLFHSVIDINPAHCTVSGNFAPGYAKLHMYDYSPFEETIYLDVDGLCIKPLSGLFELCSGKQVASQVNTVSTEENEVWPCQWMSLPDTRTVYGLPEKFNLPEINSSFMYFKKGPAAERYFDVAKQCHLPEYQTTWGKSFPDELAFNVAAALCDEDLKISDDKDTPVKFKMSEHDISALHTHTYAIGLYGASSNDMLKTYKNYGRYSLKYWAALMGRTCPYKYHHMMARKFVLGGRPLVGKRFTIPEPVKISVPEKPKSDKSKQTKKKTADA